MSTELKTLNGYGFDATKLGGLDAQYYAQGRSAHNLLDNSDFTNPVNQRGATTATLGKYFIDRWNTESFPSGPSITIDSNGLTLLPTTSSTASIYQILPDYENRKGKVHTFAICVNNVWKCVSFTMGNFGVGYLLHGLSFFSVDNRNILIRNNASDTPVPITIQRVALYEGSYTADTLPAYQPKGYAAELAECQRYFTRVGNSSAYGIISGIGCVVKVPIPTTMRNNIVPTVTLDSSLWAYSHEGYVRLNYTGVTYSTNTASLHFTVDTSMSDRSCVVPDLSCNISADL